MNRYTQNNTVCETWFERDRAMVSLETESGEQVISLVDDDVTTFVEDGFKTDRQSWHEALVEYANFMQAEPLCRREKEYYFRSDNTEGFSQEELDEMNEELDKIIADKNLDPEDFLERSEILFYADQIFNSR